jgi:methionine biosynthesis protein MetW
MKERKRLSGNIFDSTRDYYQQDWHDYYATVIKLVPSHCSVLDIGCGRGGLLEYLHDKKGCRVTGLDISEEAVRICVKRGIQVIQCDVEVDEIPGTYDVIILSAVLEHLMNPLQY